MFVGIRLPDETVAAIDEAASAIGTTRSGWIAHAVSKQLPEAGTGKTRGRPRRQKGDARVHFRMSAEELAQVERAAKQIGLTRTEFFIASARGRVWRDQGVIKHSPDTVEAMSEGIRQLNAIGVNLNQAIKALHEVKAERSESSLARSMEDLIEACSILDAGVENALDRIFAHLNAEQDAWRWRD